MIVDTTTGTKLIQQRDFSSAVVSSVPIPQSDTPTSTTATVVDSVFDVTAETSVWYDHEITVGGSWLSLTNLTPEVGSLNGNLITKENGGIGVIEIDYGFCKKRVPFDLRTYGGRVLRKLNGYVEGSNAKDSADTFLGLLDSDNLFYSTLNHGSGIYARNNGCFISSLDLTGLPVATNIHGSFSMANRGFALTARHVVGAKHWMGGVGYAIGNQIRFLDSNGDLVTKTVVGKASFHDCIVVTLDSPLPPTVTPLKIPGDWFSQEQETLSPTSIREYYGGLSFFINQNGRVKFHICGTMDGKSAAPVGTSNGITGPYFTTCVSPDVLNYSGVPGFLDGLTTHYGVGVPGDSGSAVMMLIGGEPIALWTWWSATSGVPLWHDDGAMPNTLIAAADADAVSRYGNDFNGGNPTGLTVTVAPDPTL
jgi:hypothetical protein